MTSENVNQSLCKCVNQICLGLCEIKDTGCADVFWYTNESSDRMHFEEILGIYAGGHFAEIFGILSFRRPVRNSGVSSKSKDELTFCI